MSRERFGPLDIRPQRPGDEDGNVARHNRVFASPGCGRVRIEPGALAPEFAKWTAAERQILIADHDGEGIGVRRGDVPVRHRGFDFTHGGSDLV